jgi:hypothetical protein
VNSAHPDATHSLCFADFNGDGLVDVAASLRTRPCVSLLLGTTKSEFVAKDSAPRPSPVTVGDSLTRMTVADAKRNDAMTLFSYILLRCDGSLGVRKGSTQNV